MHDPEIERLLGRPPRLSFDDIVGHPRLPEARKVYIDRFLEVYGDDPFLVRLLIETGRFQVFHLATVLEMGYDPARRETWPTVGLLKQTIATLADLALTYHIPIATLFPEIARAGGLMAYGPDLLGTFRQTGTRVGKVLQGARPADLPVERPTKFDMVVNLKTAKAPTK